MMIDTLLGEAELDLSDMGTPGDPTDDVRLELGSVLKQLVGKDNLLTLIDDVLSWFSGDMTISGTINGGIFTQLTSEISDFRLSLSENQVKALTDEAVRILHAFGFYSAIDSMLDVVASGEAYFSFGDVTVNSTFTVA